MATRNGKLAQLPNDIREQLNLRLLEGETGRELAAWLNALPEVQSILGAHFNGSPISEVNLTHWRQGGHLQWLTERECFDSARALADGDCNLATTGLSAERLLNILTLRYGELLMRWDFSPNEALPSAIVFSAMAKKARILQGISRSVLAIHRIQSQSPREKSEPTISSATSHARPKENVQATPATAEHRTEAGNARLPAEMPMSSPRERPLDDSNEANEVGMQPNGTDLPAEGKSAIRNPRSAIHRIPARTSFEAHPDLGELLQAV